MVTLPHRLTGAEYTAPVHRYQFFFLRLWFESEKQIKADVPPTRNTKTADPAYFYPKKETVRACTVIWRRRGNQLW